MRPCMLCRFEVELDDVVLTMANGTCVCLNCYCRETGNERARTKAVESLFRAVRAVAIAA